MLCFRCLPFSFLSTPFEVTPTVSLFLSRLCVFESIVLTHWLHRFDHLLKTLKNNFLKPFYLYVLNMCFKHFLHFQHRGWILICSRQHTEHQLCLLITLTPTLVLGTMSLRLWCAQADDAGIRVLRGSESCIGSVPDGWPAKKVIRGW